MKGIELQRKDQISDNILLGLHIFELKIFYLHDLKMCTHFLSCDRFHFTCCSKFPLNCKNQVMTRLTIEWQILKHSSLKF